MISFHTDLGSIEKDPDEIKHGAITIWERRDAIQEDGSVNETKSNADNMVSFNHYAFGSAGEWMKPGFQKVLLRPLPDERLEHVSGFCQSVHGKISSSWKCEEDEVHFSFETPVDARIVLPDGRKESVIPGHYQFGCKRSDL